MSFIWSSQAGRVVLATALAVSGTVIFLSLFRDKANFSDNVHSPRGGNNKDVKLARRRLRSCLSSGKEKDGRLLKKKVRFADGVKDSSGNGEEYRKAWRRELRMMMNQKDASCGIQSMDLTLSGGILENSVQLVELSH